MKINKNLMSRNHTAKVRSKKNIEFIVIHYVGALGDAKANTDYYKSTDVGASADFWVGHSGDVWQGNDYYNYYSWHCGGGRQSSEGGEFFGVCTNANSIGIEMCVKKKSTATMNATDTDWYFTPETEKACAELVKYLMEELEIDINHVIRHYDVTGKYCPNPYLDKYHKGAWDNFKTMIGAKPVEWYRVRQMWKDEKSQLGAYESKENAIENCPSGYSVYDNDGNLVYTNNGTKKKYDVATDLNGLSEKEKIEKVAPLYQQVMAETGMLASVGLAQFCLESGYGTTDLAQKANNLHGMKCSLSGNTWTGTHWDGKSKYTKQTPEQDANGNQYYITADFRAYKKMIDSIYDRAMYFIGAKNGSQLRYPNINTIHNAEKQIKLIKAGGYATDVNYVSKLMSIVDRFKLTQYDCIVAKQDALQNRILAKIQEFQSQLGNDSMHEKTWKYANSGYASTIDKAIEKKNRTTNCVILCNWIFKSLGLWESGIINHKYDGTIGYKFSTDECKKAVKENFDIIKVDSTEAKLIKNGELNPADLVFFEDHMHIYVGKDTAFDGGRNNCKNLVFQTWLGKNNYTGAKVGYIIRPKDSVPEVEPPKKVIYRVQAGFYQNASKASLTAVQMRGGGIDCIVTPKNGGYMIQCGAYAIEENAQNRVKELQSKSYIKKNKISPFYFADEIKEE